MTYKNHYIELFVNGQPIEFESQDSINIRFNNVIQDPTKISQTQAEYSFSFDIPCSPNNCKVFDYANDLAKPSKFHTRWNAELYADGKLIFQGTLTLNSIKDKMFNVNLVSVKNYSLEDIFGDNVLTDIPWYIPFDGNPSINEYNASADSTVVFPLVSYGAFQKQPKFKDSVASDYTSKYELDKYNLWYMESFPPSLSMLETIKKAFEWKGYKVQGDALSDYFLRDIFMSENIADEQDPQYNLANEKIGTVTISTNWITPSSGGTVQELKFPYFKSGNDYWDMASGQVIEVTPDYNFKKIKVYDMLDANDGSLGVNIGHPTYLYNTDENAIVIPADGFYKVELEVSAFLNTTSNLTASQWVHEWDDNVGAMSMSVSEKDITFAPDFRITTPLEIQLIKVNNNDQDIELIKGKNNMRLKDGYPDNTTELNRGQITNYESWYTCFPHEKLGTSVEFQPKPTDTSSFGDEIWYRDQGLGYMNADGTVMAYDPVVNENFIMGVTSMGNKNGGGCAAVIKNGYSWSKQYADKNDIMYTQNGYQLGYIVGTSVAFEDTEFNANTYPQSPNVYFNQTTGTLTSHIYALVHFNKNDILKLFAVHRDYTTTSGSDVSYETQAQVRLSIASASPNNMAHLRKVEYGYYSEPEFDTDLRVTNFLNKETKISDWINNVATAFNLDILQDGKSITINKRKRSLSETAVDIDDRANSNNATSKMINYPKSMAVKYKIDTDEHGYYITVPKDKINDDDWKDYGDDGYDEIMLNDDSYVTSKDEKSLQFSYTWYDNFKNKQCDSAFTEYASGDTTVRIPVISKEEYMIDGYDYTESMAHDGKGLPMRFWFRPHSVMGSYIDSENNTIYKDISVWTRTYPKEEVKLYVTENQKDELNLSYKTTERSLLEQYFNIQAKLSSNYVEIDVYLSPTEYNRLKNGALCRFDSDLYEVVEINGYDPSGNELTTLKLMKKTS